MRNVRLILMLGCIFSIHSCSTIKPEAPVAAHQIMSAPPAINSNLNIPIEVDLNPYFLMAEKAVPAQYEGSDNPCEGLRYYYQFLRSPFIISANNDVINLSFEGKYKIKGNYCAKCFNQNCLLATPTFSCGFDEPFRRIDIAYSSKIKLLPDYRLSTSTTLVKADATDPCKIGFVNIDITEKLLKEVKAKLNVLGKNVDSQVQSYSLKPYVMGFWNKLFEVQKVDQYGYLSLNPSAVSVSNLKMNGSKLSLTLGLACMPIFSVGYMPSKPMDLPNLSNGLQQKGFNVYADLIANYNDLNVLLNSKLSGKSFEIKGKNIIINNIQISGLDDSKIAMKLDFYGDKNGVVYLVGTPFFDSVKNSISIPDLTFDLKSRNVLLKAANWLLNDKLTEKIKASAVFDINSILNQTKNSIQVQLNRNLTENVQLYGKIDSMSLKNIITSTTSMFLRVLATGELGVKVK